MLRRNITFNKHIQPHEIGLFMALLKALCWALIFILRIRFPPGSSIAIVKALYYDCVKCLGCVAKKDT